MAAKAREATAGGVRPGAYPETKVRFGVLPAAPVLLESQSPD
jgi:hypothetical protein